MKTLFLMCGISFSGKSTLARKMQMKFGATIISLDEINNRRGLGLNGQAIPDEEWGRTHEIARSEISREMELGRDIILDDTNCYRWLRDRYRSLAQSHGHRTVVVYLKVDPDLARNRLVSNEIEKRRSGLPLEYFLSHVARFEKRDPDENCLVFELEEGPETWLARHFPAERTGSNEAGSR